MQIIVDASFFFCAFPKLPIDTINLSLADDGISLDNLFNRMLYPANFISQMINKIFTRILIEYDDIIILILFFLFRFFFFLKN